MICIGGSVQCIPGATTLKAIDTTDMADVAYTFAMNGIRLKTITHFLVTFQKACPLIA
jgi:hypothetical protein